MTEIRELKEEDVPALEALAIAGGHGLWRPTHAIQKDGQLTGSLSLGGIPLVTAFISKEVNSPAGLREVIRQAHGELKWYGFTDAFVALNEDSPAFRFMPSFGFTPYQSTIWYKAL